MRITFSAWVVGSLVLFSPVPLWSNTATIPVPREGHRWEQTHADHVARAKQGNIDVVFFGDSITERWSSLKVGLRVWEREFAPLKAANFGIDGDRTQHLLWRLNNGEGEGFSPKVIVLLIGTNNTGFEYDGVTPRNTPQEAVEGVTFVVQDLRKRWPNAKILLLALLPRSQAADSQRQQVTEINQALARLADGPSVKYADFGEEFMTENREIRLDLLPDKLHPDTRGYEVMAGKIKPALLQLLGH